MSVQRAGRLGAAAVLAGAGANAAAAQDDDERRERRFRVLVTGFHDWRDLENNLWRCRDNPSCRLIYGPASAYPPRVRGGPLVRELKECCPDADFCYETLPVVWGTARGLDLLSFDVVVHMGLGVYDRDDILLLERGALNSRVGVDARGESPVEERVALEEHGALIKPAEAVADNLNLLKGRTFADYTLEVAQARPENRYVCNETHYLAIKAQSIASASSPPAPLRGAYFLHLPYPKNEQHDDKQHDDLAKAVARLISALVRLHRGDPAPVSGRPTLRRRASTRTTKS